MSEKLLDFVKAVGAPAAIALGLAWILYAQLEQAAKERADHTAILVDQMYELRRACDQRAGRETP